METIYGAEGEPAGSENLTAFDILPTSAGPFFDDWEAILLEEGENERFIYRRIGLPVCEARWKLGTFKDIVLRANFELREIGGSDRDQTKGLQ